MNRSDLERLRDARKFAQDAQGNAGAMSARELSSEILAQHAVLYDLAVIGETLSKVSSEVKTAAPDLPWRATYNLRNLIVHAYWQIDLENIARIIEDELEPLMEGLERLILVVERTES